MFGNHNYFSSAGAAPTAPGAAPDARSNGDYETIDHGGVQGLTAEEETREFISAMSAGEMVAAQADLIGLSGAMGALHIGRETNEEHDHKKARVSSSTSASELRSEQFGRMAEELGKLPSEETSACRRALEECPDQVLDPRRIQMFLDYAAEEERKARCAGNVGSLFGNNGININNGGGGGTATQALVVQKAAAQLAQYWKVRETLFNGAHPNTAFLPMTQVGALTAAGALHLTTRQIWQLLPSRDTSGRSIVYFVASRKNYSEHTFYDELAGLWYLIETVMEDPDKRKEGIVFLIDFRGYSRQQTSKGAFFGLKDLMSALPISFKAFHMCHPSALIKQVIFPIWKRLSGKEIRLRLVLHYGSVNEVLTSLSGYCLPPECVPTDLGGQLVADSPSWMLSRLSIETAQMNDSPGTAVQNDTNETAGMAHVTEVAAVAATGKRDDDNDGSSNGGGIGNDCHPNLTDRQLYEKIMVEKEGKLGKKGDPRMNQALLICLEDPNLPHLDALLRCGFDFSPLSREELELRSSRVVKDIENITLKQRFDQLSRRLRTARKWIEREREEGKLLSVDSTTTNVTGAFRSGTADSGYSNTSGDTSEGSEKQGGTQEAMQGASRRDSFDEAIEELPGMEGLGDIIGENLSDEK